MKINTSLYSILLACLAFNGSNAQTAISADSLLIGVWRGSSICQVKNSPCRDEIVVYHVVKGHGEDIFDIMADKIVSGKEVEMGTISCRLDKTTYQLKSTSSNNLLTLNLKGKVLDGTLISNGELYRVIKVAKQN